MSQPTEYDVKTDFITYQSNASWFPGGPLNVEFNNLATVTDQIRANLALIQRDDGALANASVTFNALSPTLQTAGLSPLSTWGSGKVYTAPQAVIQGTSLYQCAINHVSGVFAADLAAGDWTLLANLALLSGTASVAANQVAAGPTTGAATAPTFRSLVGADMPAPTSSTLGGVQSVAVQASKWISSISALGVPSLTQPAATDISGLSTDGTLAANSDSNIATQKATKTYVDTSVTALPGVTQNFGTRTLAVAANISVSATFVRTAGYAAAGDGGDALYKHAGGTTPGGFQSADGQWWQIALTGDRLNVRAFGATGDGVTDDTTALQACINCAITNSKPVYLSHGQFLISSALNIQSTALPFSMFGHGLQSDCNLIMTSASQNGLYFNSSSRITLQGFGIRPNGGVTPTSGACIFVDGVVNTGNQGFIDNVDMVGFNGITATGLQQFCISNCGIAARGTCISLANPGDSTIYGNRLTMTLSTAAGITVPSGNAGGLRISNNKINGAGAACMTVTQNPPGDGDLLIENNSMEGANFGIVITTVSSTTLGNVMIIGNEIGVTSDCIQFPSTSTGWLLNMIISGNNCNTATAGAGITILAASYFVVTGNIISGGAGPGSGRLTLGAGTIQGLVYGNIVPNAGGIANSGTGNVITNNLLST